ncbi:DNA mismatch repair endonuclease MutL [Thermotoga sp. SG1]|uniref:DNA mismatch repair endonuclease MutL n=1 Tax=Thermotoga sp. SG1 TaxID=126739 RepID=UPI000C771C9E|nr:DNA mismatch repair endonuclease MutL [Thermotoga sp. SG1]PLV57117.1 DNA mismatch repair protein MutL [Thermotoga sp. SG1]
MRIRRLPESLVRKIAAGEVIHNPSFVVKELVENSLDAQATKVVVEVENGGKNLVRVSDNGTGMTKEEVLVAIEPHTTSKIEKEEDLYRIRTYGFRGEALASIVQVSRTRIVTKTKEDVLATQVLITGGKVEEISETHRDSGTTVEVKDLFFNLPVRRKSLKSSSIELRMCREMFERFALVKNNVDFAFISDGRIVHSFPATSGPFERALLILEDLRKGYITFEEELSDLKIKGIVSTREITRPNRTGEYFYVNGRFVISEELHEVLMKVYDLPKRRYPIAVLFVETDPEKLDVNIHPSKIVVRFLEEEKIKRALEEVLAKNLARKWYRSVTYEEISSRALSVAESSSYRWFLVKKKYAVVETEDALFFIDLHALHERVIYEEILSKKVWRSKNLKRRIITSLPDEEREKLQELGFSFQFEGESLVVQKVPEFLTEDAVEEFFKEIIHGSTEMLKEKIALAACKLATKSGEFDEKTASRLVDLYFQKKYERCPHGRPISFRISYEDLDRFFER